MTTWTELLDGYESAVAAVEDALASGVGPPGGTWRPPEDPPARAPTPQERQRLAELQARAAACLPGLAAASAAAADELDTVRRTGKAARAYGRVEQLTGGPVVDPDIRTDIP